MTFSSAAGGVGRTTLVATLGQALARFQRPVLLVDFDPANQLGLLLGAVVAPQQGIGSALARGDHWASSALQAEDGLRYLPFGETTAQERSQLLQRLGEQPQRLQEELSRLLLPDDTLVLIDTPRRPAVLADAASAAADCVIEVLQPSVLSYSTLGSLPPVNKRLFLLNGFDATRGLDNDIRALLIDQLGAALLPYAVHRDEAVSEALAADIGVLDYVQSSQAVRDLQALARWLMNSPRAS